MGQTFSTVRDLCTFSLKNAGIIGIGQTAGAEQINDAHTFLKGMLNSWRQNRWLVFRTVDHSYVGDGIATKTVGPGGDIDIPSGRPARLETGNWYVQLVPAGNTQVSFPLQLIQSRQDYNQLVLKNLRSVPWALWYDPQLPLGVLHTWPVPSSQYEIHIVVKEPIDTLDSLDDSLTGLPDEYAEPLWSNLAIRCAGMKGGSAVISDIVRETAVASLQNMMTANFAMKSLVTPSDLGPMSPGYGFNIINGW